MLETLRNEVTKYKSSQAQTIIGAGIIGIAILVIILDRLGLGNVSRFSFGNIYSQVQQSLPTPTSAVLSSASTNVTTTFAASMDEKSRDCADFTQFWAGGTGLVKISTTDDRSGSFFRYIGTRKKWRALSAEWASCLLIPGNTNCIGGVCHPSGS